MVAFYPLCAFGENRVAASIDTPLHSFLPFPHVDHLHPDWAIALAASANGKARLEQFNQKYGRKIVWVPWQRPGFELALMLRKAVEDNPGCDGIILGGHGLFTWGDTQKDCYLSSIKTIDQMGEFVQEHAKKGGRAQFGGAIASTAADRESIVGALLPYLRGAVSSNRRVIAHYDSSEDALAFANSEWAEQLCQLGTSCPDHFLRTRISPLYLRWKPEDGLAALKQQIADRLATYREDYKKYYQAHAEKDSPALRDSNPSVVVDPGHRPVRLRQGQARGAHHVGVLRQRHPRDGGRQRARGSRTASPARRRRRGARSRQGSSRATGTTSRCRAPRRSASNTGRSKKPSCSGCRPSGSSAARSWSWSAAPAVSAAKSRWGSPSAAHTWSSPISMPASAEAVAKEAAALSSPELVLGVPLDLSSRDSIAAAFRATVMKFGGLDAVINTAAIFPTPAPGTPPEQTWGLAMSINVTSNHVLADEAAKILKEQGLPASVVLTSSANAVVPKSGSEPYDVSKAAINHLIRELAIGLGPLVRVNGIAPATVIEGSSMFPRDRVMVSLKKYNIEFSEEENTESLRSKLAEFYARRTITRRPILPTDCANAILFLAGDQSAKTTGHVIPVDGGLPEAFLRDRSLQRRPLRLKTSQEEQEVRRINRLSSP